MTCELHHRVCSLEEETYVVTDNILDVTMHVGNKNEKNDKDVLTQKLILLRLLHQKSRKEKTGLMYSTWKAITMVPHLPKQ